MATAQDQLSGLNSLLTAINGQKQTTKQSQTTQTNVSDAGVNELIRGILSGQGGVRTIGNAARSSGLYNSTTEDKMLGDLYSSAAVKAELARSPTTTSTKQTVETPGMGGSLGTIGGLIAGAQTLNALSGGGLGNLASEGIGNLVSGLFGTGSGAAANAASSATSNVLSNALTEGVSNTLGGTVAAGSAGSLGAFGANAATDAATSAASGAAGSTAGSAAAGAGASAVGSYVPLVGNFLGGFLGGKDAAEDPTSLAMAAALGASALGPVGLVAAPLASIAGGFLSDMSVVCTALMDAGLVSKERHDKGMKYLSSLSKYKKIGYWTWGIPVSKKIREGSKFWIKFTNPIVKEYIELAILEKRTWKDYLKNPYGSLAYFIGEPMCELIGKVVIKWDLFTYKIKLQAK